MTKQQEQPQEENKPKERKKRRRARHGEGSVFELKDSLCQAFLGPI